MKMELVYVLLALEEMTVPKKYVLMIAVAKEYARINNVFVIRAILEKIVPIRDVLNVIMMANVISRLVIVYVRMDGEELIAI